MAFYNIDISNFTKLFISYFNSYSWISLFNRKFVFYSWWVWNFITITYLFTLEHEKKYFIRENIKSYLQFWKQQIFTFLFIFCWTFNFAQTSFITSFCLFKQNEISNVPTPDIDVHFRHSLLSLFVIIIMFAFSFYIKEL